MTTSDPSQGSVRDDRYDHFVNEQAGSRPRGYPRLAAYINEDIEGRLFRRFGYVRARLLLYHQDKIACLERQLDQLDSQDEAALPYRLASREYDEKDPNDAPRKALMVELSEQLRMYDELLLRDNEVMRIDQPSRRSHRKYFDYIWNEKPLCREEYAFILRQDDFVALGLPDDNWFGSFIDGLERVTPKWLLNILLKPKHGEGGNGDANVTQYSNRRTNLAVRIIIGTVSTLLLLLPVITLHAATLYGASGWVTVGIVSAFTVVFTMALLSMTRITRKELFASVATYAAVLVVFLGNTPS